jgi:hypothetical protein
VASPRYRELMMVDSATIKGLRYRVRLEVIKFNGKPGAGAYVIDVDHSGAKLETEIALSLQYPVEFSFSLPGTCSDIMVSGRVMWRQQLTEPLGKYHVGVQFHSPRWDLDTLLCNIVKNQG